MKRHCVCQMMKGDVCLSDHKTEGDVFVVSHDAVCSAFVRSQGEEFVLITG